MMVYGGVNTLVLTKPLPTTLQYVRWLFNTMSKNGGSLSLKHYM